jgi:hypothetical protein
LFKRRCRIAALRILKNSYCGNQSILNRAKEAIDVSGVYGGNDPYTSVTNWSNNTGFDYGHAVITYENLRLPALAYPWTGQSKYLDATLNYFAWLNKTNMLPYGVCSGEECTANIGAFRLTETCDVPCMLWAYAWLYRFLGNRSWGDEMELSFFNAGKGSVSRDFSIMCYYQSPNRISDTGPAPVRQRLDRPLPQKGNILTARASRRGLEIRCRVTGDYVLGVSDLKGRSVFERKGRQAACIGLNTCLDLGANVYVIKLYAGGAVLSRKAVVVK